MTAWHAVTQPSWTCHTNWKVPATLIALAMASASAVALCVVNACCEAACVWVVPKQNATQPNWVCITNWIVEATLTASAPVWVDVALPVAVAVCVVAEDWVADCVCVVA